MVAVLRTGIELGQVALQHAHLGAGAQTPLFVNHATLLLYLLLFEQQSVGPVVENEQAGVDDALAGRRHITYIIYRLVNRGVGIQVGSELHANALAPAQQLVALEVLRAIEGHVLQEVGQSALVVILLDGADLLCNVELGTILGPVVVTDVIRQSIVQFTDANIGVNGNCWHLLCHHCYTTGQRQHETKE